MKKILVLLLVLAMLFGAFPAFSYAESDTFSDVPSGYWVKQYIEEAFSGRYVEGTYFNEETGERRFSPESPLTIAQFCTILSRMYFSTQYEQANRSGGSWDAPAKSVALDNALLDNSIIKSDAWSKPISRFHIAVIMSNICQALDVFPTNQASMAAGNKLYLQPGMHKGYYSDVKKVYALGLIEGTNTAGTFNGDRTMTRAQAATVCCRLSRLRTRDDKGLPG